MSSEISSETKINFTILKKEAVNKKLVRSFKKFMCSLLKKNTQLFRDCLNSEKSNSFWISFAMDDKILPPCKIKIFDNLNEVVEFRSFNDGYLKFVFSHEKAGVFYNQMMNQNKEQYLASFFSSESLLKNHPIKLIENEKVVLNEYVSSIPQLYGSDYNSKSCSIINGLDLDKLSYTYRKNSTSDLKIKGKKQSFMSSGNRERLFSIHKASIDTKKYSDCVGSPESWKLQASPPNSKMIFPEKLELDSNINLPSEYLDLREKGNNQVNLKSTQTFKEEEMASNMTDKDHNNNDISNKLENLGPLIDNYNDEMCSIEHSSSYKITERLHKSSFEGNSIELVSKQKAKPENSNNMEILTYDNQAFNEEKTKESPDPKNQEQDEILNKKIEEQKKFNFEFIHSFQNRMKNHKNSKDILNKKRFLITLNPLFVNKIKDQVNEQKQKELLEESMKVSHCEGSLEIGKVKSNEQNMVEKIKYNMNPDLCKETLTSTSFLEMENCPGSFPNNLIDQYNSFFNETNISINNSFGELIVNTEYWRDVPGI